MMRLSKLLEWEAGGVVDVIPFSFFRFLKNILAAETAECIFSALETAEVISLRDHKRFCLAAEFVPLKEQIHVCACIDEVAIKMTHNL